jgi:hypothetical protein
MMPGYYVQEIKDVSKSVLYESVVYSAESGVVYSAESGV